MARKRQTGTVPQPPWSYSPSEVAEWMASTAGPSPPREPRARRQVRVKGFIGECPTSAEGRLLRRLSKLGFEPAEKAHRLPPLLTRLTHPKEPSSFSGKLGLTRVHIRLRKGTALSLRLTFTPRVSQRLASKLIYRLGLRNFEGTWT
ncbi:MAG: hypothetical protein ACREDF_08175 [Thermoplasmata archaeon]